MSIVKTIHVPVSAESWGPTFMNVTAPGKSALHVAKPTEFGGVSGSFWTPEELLVNALASCYAITLKAVAARLRLPVRDLHVDALGHLERRRDGGWAFALIELEIELMTDPGLESVAERATRVAEERCIIGRALQTPLDVRVVVSTAAKEVVAA